MLVTSGLCGGEGPGLRARDIDDDVSRRSGRCWPGQDAHVDLARVTGRPAVDPAQEISKGARWAERVACEVGAQIRHGSVPVRELSRKLGRGSRRGPGGEQRGEGAHRDVDELWIARDQMLERRTGARHRDNSSGLGRRHWQSTNQLGNRARQPGQVLDRFVPRGRGSKG